ncbi:MAG TPA: hypothetical protein VFJ52_06585, partial [Terriglobia bacterium]|nr:hypothetical protein [Terriglobia bacterium]
MARFTLAVIVCGVAVRLYELAYGTRLIGSILWLLVFIGLMIAGVYYLVRLITYVRQRMLWRLSGRLAVTYVFIAFVPIVLILVLVVIGAMIINGQFAAFLVSQRLDNHFDELKQLNRVVAREAIHTAARKPAQLIGELHAFYVDDLGHYASSYPGLQITLRVGVEAEAFTLTGQRLDDVITMPPWLTQEEWAGVTTDEGKIALRAVDHVGTPAGNLALILSMPITPELLNQVGEGIGPVEVYEGRGGNPAQPNSNPNPNPSLNAIHSSSLARPEAHSWLDFPVFGVSEINPVDWRSNDFHRRNTSVVMAVYSRVYALNGQLFRTLGRHSSVPVDIFIAVCIVFLIIEIVALA